MILIEISVLIQKHLSTFDVVYALCDNCNVIVAQFKKLEFKHNILGTFKSAI